jgi:hypothetical protein
MRRGMQKDQKWLENLTGKSRQIAACLLRGQNDEQIIREVPTTLGTVQKIRSQMRKHGFEMARGAMNATSSSGDLMNRTFASAGVSPMADGIDADVRTMVYAKFREGVSAENIAQMFQLAAHHVLQLRWEWLTLIGCDSLAKLEKESSGVLHELPYLLEYMKEEKSKLKAVVDKLKRLGNLEKHTAQLEKHVQEMIMGVKSYREDQENLLFVNKDLENQIRDKQQRMKSLAVQYQESKNQAALAILELDKVQREVSQTKKHLGAERDNLLEFIKTEVQRHAKVMLNDASYLWKRAVMALILAGKENASCRADFVNLILNNPLPRTASMGLEFVEQNQGILTCYLRLLEVDLTERSMSGIVPRFEAA